MTSPEPASLPTLRQEWLLIGVVSLLFTICVSVDIVVLPADAVRAGGTPLFFVAAFLHAIGAAVWITMDRKRRGREVGLWRFGAVFLGPLVILLYVVMEYKAKALVLVPLVLVFYALLLAVLPTLAVVLFRHV